MTVGIMQPYFLPYLGYWQLLAAVDRFVVYDDIQYTKKGWINRNRFLRNGAAAYFTVPLRQGSHLLDVADRAIADDFRPAALLKPMAEAYRHAPFFASAYPVIETVISAAPRNLFEYLHYGLTVVAEYLEIRTPVIVSSTVAVDRSLKSQERVLGLCAALGATRYVNAMGGRELYSLSDFAERGIELRFLQSRPVPYPQYDDPFVPNLSIVDVLMFNSRDAVRGMLGSYELV